MTEKRLKFVVPGDFPPQIQGSPHLDRLQPYGDVDLYLDRPRDMAEQLERVQGAHVILNTRGAIKWFAPCAPGPAGPAPHRHVLHWRRLVRH